MDIGRVGIWTFSLDLQPAARAQEAAAELEALGYGAIWLPEALGREPFSSAGLLLAATTRIVLATGIANIWARDAMAMAAGQQTLTEAYPDRFLLGIGVSHAPLVGMRGHTYDKPLSAMRRYLDAMDSAPYLASAPTVPPVRVIAALAPRCWRWRRSAAEARIRTSSHRSIPRWHVPSSVPARGCAPSRPSSSTPTPTARDRSRGPTWLPIWASRTT